MKKLNKKLSEKEIKEKNIEMINKWINVKSIKRVELEYIDLDNRKMIINFKLRGDKV
jgi:hypothetical protein